MKTTSNWMVIFNKFRVHHLTTSLHFYLLSYLGLILPHSFSCKFNWRFQGSHSKGDWYEGNKTSIWILQFLKWNIWVTYEIKFNKF